MHLWPVSLNNTGVGCHCLLHCVKVKSASEVSQSRPTRSDPMDCSLPGSSIHGIFQARVLEWGASAFSWRIPGTAEPGGLPSMGSHRVGHNRSDLAAAAAVSIRVPRLFNGKRIVSSTNCAGITISACKEWPFLYIIYINQLKMEQNLNVSAKATKLLEKKHRNKSS